MGIVGAHGLTLGLGERLLACATPTLWLYTPRWLMALATGSLSYFFGTMGFSFFPWAGWVAMSFLLLWAELDRWSSRVWITDRRLAVRISWLHRKVISLNYSQLAGCTRRQNALERGLGVGAIWVHSTLDTHALLIQGTHNPAELCALIERVHSLRGER